jgi:small subunit ribosomal protein S15
MVTIHPTNNKYTLYYFNRTMVLLQMLRNGVPRLKSSFLQSTFTPLTSLMKMPSSAFEASFPSFSPTQFQQIRTTMSKRKKRIMLKKRRWAALAANGIFPPRPNRYIDKETPVRNAKRKEERDAEIERLNEAASLRFKERMQSVEGLQKLRFNTEGLIMSDRVRKLFDLTNGNQKEVIKAQRQSGMKLFQIRDGDTGSGSVQGELPTFEITNNFTLPLKRLRTHFNSIDTIVIALTTRIQQLQTHLKSHKKDKSSKRGMDALYVRRRKVLDYLERTDFESYRLVVKALGLVR